MYQEVWYRVDCSLHITLLRFWCMILHLWFYGSGISPLLCYTLDHHSFLFVSYFWFCVFYRVWALNLCINLVLLLFYFLFEPLEFFFFYRGGLAFIYGYSSFITFISSSFLTGFSFLFSYFILFFPLLFFSVLVFSSCCFLLIYFLS